MSLRKFATAVFALLLGGSCIDNGAYGINEADLFQEEGVQLLSSAACRGDVSEVKRIIEDGSVDVDRVGKFGVTPLIWAITCQEIEFSDILAGKAAKSMRGVSNAAFDTQSLGAIEELLLAGADPNKKI